MTSKEKRVAAFLVVKERDQVAWYLFFTDKEGEFVSLAIIKTIGAFNELFERLRLGGAEEARVRREATDLTSQLGFEGGPGVPQWLHGNEARRYAASMRNLLCQLTGDDQNECYIPGNFFGLDSGAWHARVYNTYQPPADMSFTDKLFYLLQPFLPATA